jgi:hypothetical protein
MRFTIIALLAILAARMVSANPILDPESARQLAGWEATNRTAVVGLDTQSESQAIQVNSPPAPEIALGILLTALWLESLTVAILARRKHWFTDALVWMVITLGTYLLMIILPLRCWDLHIQTTSDAFTWRVLLLEVLIVIVEARILWLLRTPKGKGRQRHATWFPVAENLSISLAGNCVSFFISVGCLPLLTC